MASQDRSYKLIKRLSQEHQVDLAAIVQDSLKLNLTREKLAKIVNNFYPIISLNYNKSKIIRKIIGLKWLYNYLLFGISSRHYYWGHKKIMQQLEHIIEQNKYDIVQLVGWYSGKIFKNVSTSTYKAIDTHGVLYEKKIKEYQDIYGEKIPFFKQRELEKDKEKEIAITGAANLVISISEYDRGVFRSLIPESEHILIPSGQDISFYKSYSLSEKEKTPTILFYGSLGGKQNYDAFFRLYNKIFPRIIKQIPETRLLVLGGNPPDKIKRLGKKPNIEVTGFVEDVRRSIAQASVMILPMEIAAGFRSRVVEVMAMGVPVLGTHNALDSIGFSNGIDGIIEDNNELLADFAVRLLKDCSLLERMSKAAQIFIDKNYDIEATYGKLSGFYGSLV
jgi:glycosyltransferase involved in cell wall biosynthesis